MTSTAPGLAPEVLHRETEKRDDRGRLRGIDSIRAISAFIVVLGHIGLLSEATVHGRNHLLRLLGSASAIAWNGPAAVIVFFVVSGFCIHLPFRAGRPLNPVSFFTRRILRVGLPAVAAYLFARFVVHDLKDFDNVIWSVLCELIYYLLYPAIGLFSRKIGWRVFFVVAYVVSVVLAFSHLHKLVIEHNGYTALGSSLTWLVGLPCWILGCWLAETEKSFRALPESKIWLLRAGIFALAVGLRVVKFHVSSPLASNVLTLNLFAVVACIWLGYEIAYFKLNDPHRSLEWMGTWSYSLYLMHPLTTATVAALGISWLAQMTIRIHWCLLPLALLLAYLFHKLVEQPSHRLAIMASRKV